jgi:hypothetical protein
VSAVSGRRRSRWWRFGIPVAAALVGAAVATLVLAGGGRGATTAEARAPAPPTTAEHCRWQVTGGDGRVHTFGGARVRGWSTPGAIIHSSLTGGYYTLMCTAHGDGESYSSITLMARAADARPGEHVVAGAETSINLAFAGFPQHGFVDAAYDSARWNDEREGVPMGTIAFRAIALEPGARVAGAASGTLGPRFSDENPISIRVEFDFTQ